MLKRLRTALGGLLIASLAACGGGGSGGGCPYGGTVGSCNSAPDPGTGGGTVTPTASDLSLVLSANSVTNSGSDTVTATVTAVDSNRNAVANIPVTMSVDNSATIQVSGSKTDSKGLVSGTVSIGALRSNRVITVTATSGSLTQQAVLQVTGTKVTATALPATLAPSTAGKVQYRVVDTNGSPLIGIPITISGVSGAEASGQTGQNGDYEYSYTSPNTPGNIDIHASSGGVENIATVVVQSSGTGTIPVVAAGTIKSATVAANPSVVSVNTAGSTTNRAEVRALFVGDKNAPIPNVRVWFDLNGDASSVGGKFTTGNGLVYSDVNGAALSSYIPDTRFSPTNGVTIRACWDYADFIPPTCPHPGTAALTTVTVSSDALSVSIGTNELIVLPNDLSYAKQFVVQVNDSSGLAKANVSVSPLLDLVYYLKGFYTKPGDSWLQTVTAARCDNEDLNRNGVMDPGEDANVNGQLDPRKADVIVSIANSGRTDSTGQVILTITYPRNYGSWIDFKLTVAAAGVAGTEGRASYSGVLPVPAAAIKADGAPAFVTSPYGTAGSPTVLVTTSDGTITGSLCTNPN